MSVLSALFDHKIDSFEQAFGAEDITSTAMRGAIRSWFALYFDGAVPKDEDDCQRLPVVIVNKLCKTVFSEYTATAQGSKAVFLSDVLQHLGQIQNTAMQQVLVGGECLIKPVLSGSGFIFVPVRRDCFLPLARDPTGRITSVGTVELSAVGGKYYTLMERRTVRAQGLTIESKLYVSDTRSSVGREVPLQSLEKYAMLEPSITLPLDNIGMAQVKTPQLNCVDGLQDGVSVYAPAVALIRNINRNERQLDDEFENGASRIIVSSDMLGREEDGRRKLKENVFTAVDEDPDSIGIQIFSPALREASYLARKQEYLRNIESQIGLKRGILSEVEATERTATEITSSAGDYNLTILDFQSMWERAVRELLGICNALGRAYRLCDDSPFDPDTDLTIDWGDGVLFDRTRTWQEYQSMVQADMLKAELALAWYFNLPHETPADLQKIREIYIPEMESMLGGA